MVKLQSVNYNVDQNGYAHVAANYFMAYHTILKSSPDYYGALREARVISDNMTQMIQENLILLGKNGSNVEVFPYR